MDKALKNELKKILTGRVILNQEGVLRALVEGEGLIFHGVADGWASVRFLGITKRESCFQLNRGGDAAFAVTFSAMQNLGRLVELTQSPGTIACLRRYVLNKPVVIGVDYEGSGIIRVNVYTGKGLFAGIACRRGMADFCRALPPGEMNPVEVGPVKRQEEEPQKVHTPPAPASKGKRGKHAKPKRLKK